MIHFEHRGLSLLQVLKESFKLYRAINDGIINLVDKVSMVLVSLFTLLSVTPLKVLMCLALFVQFFEMQRHDAIKALEIYKRAGQQVNFFHVFNKAELYCELTRRS